MAKKPYKSVCGLGETAVDQFIIDAEAADRGTTRYPWPPKFKSKVKARIEGMTSMQTVKDAVNALVVADLGPGLHGRGPFEQDLAGNYR